MVMGDRGVGLASAEHTQDGFLSTLPSEPTVITSWGFQKPHVQGHPLNGRLGVQLICGALGTTAPTVFKSPC